MTFNLPKLSYAYDFLEPVIDAKTMEIHYTKHHQAYIDNLNKALEAFPELQKKSVNELLAGNLSIVPDSIKTAVRNNAGGHANHSLFWELLTSNKGDNEQKGKVIEAIKKKFGSFDSFKAAFSDAAMKRFGSGWAWLVLSNGELEIISTANQDSPIMEGKKPVLGLDVWEHAYYLKYQNRRKEYVDSFWSIVNWKKVDEIYSAK